MFQMAKLADVPRRFLSLVQEAEILDHLGQIKVPKMSRYCQFLDASSHLYKRVCPSIRRLVGRSVNPFVYLPIMRFFFKLRKLNHCKSRDMDPCLQIICTCRKHPANKSGLFVYLQLFLRSFLQTNICLNELVFSRVLATLYVTLSVSRSIRRSVRWYVRPSFRHAVRNQAKK